MSQDSKKTQGYLGIDAGTQGLSVIFTDQSLNVVATGEGEYAMQPELEPGCYEQSPADWEAALVTAMEQLRANFQGQIEVVAIGISAQMHGEVLADVDGNPLGPARLWCDHRNEPEGNELTEAFGIKMPKRITAARWLWTIRNRPELAKRVAHMTTPAGWIAYRLTGEWVLGIGDAAGMFPIDQSTRSYDVERLAKFDSIAGGPISLSRLLPIVKTCGESGGVVNQMGSQILGVPEGIPVAPAEGDQPAALAGSLIGKPGMVSCSFGTSVCANSVGDRTFEGVSQAIDHFCAPDGKPINMVWLRNGTTFMNSVVEMFAHVGAGDRESGFESVIPQLLSAAPDCAGLLALPFMDDEPGLGVQRGGTAMLIGLNPDNATPGNVAKAALLSTMFNLKLGSETLDGQGFPRTELVLTGGLTRSPELGQILADVFDTPVTMLESAEEGTAWGAALLAKFRAQRLEGKSTEWVDFLAEQETRQGASSRTRLQPDQTRVAAYAAVYQRYLKLIAVQPDLERAVHEVN